MDSALGFSNPYFCNHTAPGTRTSNIALMVESKLQPSTTFNKIIFRRMRYNYYPYSEFWDAFNLFRYQQSNLLGTSEKPNTFIDAGLSFLF